MIDSFFLSLRKDATFTSQGKGQAALQCGPLTAGFSHLSSGIMTALRRLGSTGESEDRLAEIVLESDGAEALARFYYFLGHLSQWSLLRRSVRQDGTRLATLESISPYFEYATGSIAPESRYRLSRFVYTHVEGGEMVLESPLSHARIILDDQRVATLLHALAWPRHAEELEIAGLTSEAITRLMTLLLNARMLTSLNEAGESREDDAPSLRSWEFHDLLFHSRSRKGRHDHPVGGTYRFAGVLDPPPALKSANYDGVISLPRPDLERCKREDPPFALVQDARKSIRQYDAKPITIQQLGEFLYRVGRAKQCGELEVPTTSDPIRMEFAFRPYPAGGALYELELYVAVNACADIEAGLYHYDPRNHQLGRISGRTEEVDELLRGAGRSTTIPNEELQLLIIIAARFQRMSWKYASMAYAATLKHVGVLYQTMYLAATAMELAPCGVGCGDSDLFARAIGSNYYDETSVGEFLLGSKKIQ